jgi:DNA-binding transcriptional LysR family regulator
VEVTLGVTNAQVSLIRREADVALRLDNNPAEGLVGRRVGRLQFEAYAARSLVERVGHGATLADFPWLHSDERSDGRWLDNWLARNAPGARVSLRSDDFAVRRRALSEEARDLWVLTLPELRNNSRIRAFMDHVHEAFKPHQRALEGAHRPETAHG